MAFIELFVEKIIGLIFSMFGFDNKKLNIIMDNSKEYIYKKESPTYVSLKFFMYFLIYILAFLFVFIYFYSLYYRTEFVPSINESGSIIFNKTFDESYLDSSWSFILFGILYISFLISARRERHKKIKRESPVEIKNFLNHFNYVWWISLLVTTLLRLLLNFLVEDAWVFLNPGIINDSIIANNASNSSSLVIALAVIYYLTILISGMTFTVIFSAFLVRPKLKNKYLVQIYSKKIKIPNKIKK